jgi:hypothetical protein
MRAQPCRSMKISGSISILLFFIGCLSLTIPQMVESKDGSKWGGPKPRTPTGQIIGNLNFTAMAGGANPSAQTLKITNTGGGTLSWNAYEDASWLALNPTSGTTTTETDIITVTVNTSGLMANTYKATITVSTQAATSATQQIPVTLTVTAPSPTIGKSPVNLAFTGTQDGSNPTPQTFAITNPGTETLNWSVTDDAPWLTVTPLSGTTTTDTDLISVSVNTAGLTGNMYTATITLTDPSASNSPQQIPVTLALTAPTSSTAFLSWDANTEEDLAGYKVYIGTASRAYGPPVDVGNVTSFKVLNLVRAQTYYFAVTAYDTSGNESGYSTEVSKTIN